MKVKLHKQEMEGQSKFNGQIVYTRGISTAFGDCVFELVFKSIALLAQLISQNKADYFQVFTAEHDGKLIKYWVIDGIDAVTFLLPEEY